MPNERVPRNVFIDAWNGCTCVSDVAERLVVDEDYCRVRASKLRRAGHALRYYRNPGGPELWDRVQLLRARRDALLSQEEVRLLREVRQLEGERDR